MSARSIKVPFRYNTGREGVLIAYPTMTPGLVIHKAVNPCSSEDCFVVTHARSGCYVPRCWRSPEAALAFAEAAGAMADWQLDMRGLIKATGDVRSAVLRLALEMGGRRHRDGGPLAPGVRAPDNGVIA